jgi:hypothetical protein
MFADALLIQPVVLSRDTGTPAMGIESSGAVGGGCGLWHCDVVVCLPQWFEQGWRGEMGALNAGGMIPRAYSNTRRVRVQVRLGWGAVIY